jgi:adenylosuccinate lyase
VNTPEETNLSAISPLDGRYRREVAALSAHFSEAALWRYRVRVEVEYLLFLSRSPRIGMLPALDGQQAGALRNLYRQFSLDDAAAIAAWDRKVNHDVKAVEYWLREKLVGHGLADHQEAVHFALTSEDVNNLAYALMVQEARDVVLLPALGEILGYLREQQVALADAPLLAKTHGQPATPTTMGKELAVFAARINHALGVLAQTRLTGKLNGASGTYAAHVAALPDVDWITFSSAFVKFLGLEPTLLSTQIEPHDTLVEVGDALRRVNTILVDMAQDLWRYISDNIFGQAAVAGEVGSSTMPHKVNPIDFENAEGNLLLANALLEFFGRKLPISRLQRDLSDSTVLRNLGVAFGHSLFAYRRLLRGLRKLAFNAERAAADLRDHPEVLTEAIQTILRRERYPEPYEAMKKLARGRQITLADLHEFIGQLDVSAAVRDELLALRPETYIGLAAKLARRKE